MTASKIQMDQIRSTSATVTGENIRAGSQKKSSLSPAEGLQGASPDATCTCPSGNGSLRHPCPAHPAVEQAGGDERAVDGKPRATKCPDCGEGDLMPGDLCACGYETDPAAGYACSECDGSGDGYVGEVCRECDGSGWFVTPEQARAALAQPSGEVVVTKNESGAIVSVTRQDKEGRVLSVIAESQPSPVPTEGFTHFPELLESVQQMDAMLKANSAQAEAERPEVVAWRYGFSGGIVSDKACLDEWKSGGEYQSLMTVAQHERIVGALRAVIAQLRQHKNDYMDSGQETYRALQNEIREREAEIARLDGLVSGRTAERDAALAKVERLRESKGDPSGSFDRCMKMMYERDENAKRLDAALARVAELEKGTVYVEARQCDECQHVGINDSADGLAACHDCDWTGPEPDEDKCPDCQRENCMAAACPQCGARYVLVASEEIAAPVAQAQPEETPGEILAAKLIETWVAKHGKPAPWSKIVEITALATNMPNDERDRLLALDYDVDAQAQHSVPIAHEFKRALGLVVAALEADGDRPTSKYALSELKKVLAAAPGTEVPQAWLDVQAERRRQITAEGWTPEHDDLYCAAELPRAAAAYILNGANDEAPAIWPFSAKWWKPRDARSNYVRAGALILAEIERLDRAAPGKEGNDD